MWWDTKHFVSSSILPKEYRDAGNNSIIRNLEYANEYNTYIYNVLHFVT